MQNETNNTNNLNTNINNKERFTSKIEDKLEVLKEKQINPDNIFDFYDHFLDGLIDISEEVLSKYIKETRVPTKTDREKGIQEDEAFKYFNLSSISHNIDSMSEIIEERSSRLEELKEEVIRRSNFDSRLFVPPEKDEKYNVEKGSGNGMEEKRNIPRLLTLIYILENDLDMKLEDNQDITITEGITVSNMMRKIPYVRVLIPELNRIVYICNEEGNASFIFDKKFIDENHIVLESLDENSKPDFKDIIELNKNAGVRINQSKNWRERILTALTKNISEFETKTSKINSDLEKRMDYSTPEGFKKLIEEVRLQGIKSSSDYDNKQQENKWPTSKYLKNIFAKLYPGKTFSWDLFLGRDPYSTKEGFRRLVEEVRSKQIKSSGEYGEKQQENKWPVPKTLFKNFTNLYPGKTFSWDLFLARETYSTKEGFKKLIEEVRLQGIKSSSDYNKQKENKWPAYDTLMSIFFKLYPNKTFSWDLFLGREMFILKKQDYESANSLSRKIHSNKYTIKKFAEIYRKDHPEWFEMQKAGVNIAEHYSPELVNIIKEHFENKNGNNTN